MVPIVGLDDEPAAGPKRAGTGAGQHLTSRDLPVIVRPERGLKLPPEEGSRLEGDVVGATGGAP